MQFVDKVLGVQEFEHSSNHLQYASQYKQDWRIIVVTEAHCVMLLSLEI